MSDVDASIIGPLEQVIRDHGLLPDPNGTCRSNHLDGQSGTRFTTLVEQVINERLPGAVVAGRCLLNLRGRSFLPEAKPTGFV